MEFETIYGQVVSKANHYLAVPAKNGDKRIIKDSVIREYEKEFARQCKIYKGRMINQPFRFTARVYYKHWNHDVDNSIKTVMDCLQQCGAITNDNLMQQLTVSKHISVTPRIEFCIEILQKSLFD